MRGPVPCRPAPWFVAGDALLLPFRDQAFDAVTISFGLRNVADPDLALAELLRVTRPGGRLVICEFGHLPWPRLNTVYESYLVTALPVVARRLSGSPEAYDYLAESIKDWPAQPELARRIAAAGWSAVRWRNLTMGVVAVHHARRPALSAARRGRTPGASRTGWSGSGAPRPSSRAGPGIAPGRASTAGRVRGRGKARSRLRKEHL